MLGYDPGNVSATSKTNTKTKTHTKTNTKTKTGKNFEEKVFMYIAFLTSYILYIAGKLRTLSIIL